MNAGTLLRIGRDVTTLLETHGILLPDGEFDGTALDTLSENLAFASGVEAILKARGVDVPERLHEILQTLPLLAAVLR